MDSLTSLSKKSIPYTPISLPTEGLLSNVMICSRCGCRRQIRNVPFFSLSIPIVRPLLLPLSLLEPPSWRLDPSLRRLAKLFYLQLADSFGLSNPLHPTLLDCLRRYTAPDEVDDVRCEGYHRILPSILAADWSTPFWTPPISPTSRSLPTPCTFAPRTAVNSRNFETNSRSRFTACGRRTTSTRSFIWSRPVKRSA